MRCHGPFLQTAIKLVTKIFQPKFIQSRNPHFCYLNRTNKEQSPLFNVGVMVWKRFMEQAKGTGTTLRMQIITKGNIVSHDGNGVVDAALFVTRQLGSKADKRQFRDLHGVMPLEYLRLDETTHCVLDLHNTLHVMPNNVNLKLWNAEAEAHVKTLMRPKDLDNKDDMAVRKCAVERLEFLASNFLKLRARDYKERNQSDTPKFERRPQLTSFAGN